MPTSKLQNELVVKIHVIRFVENKEEGFFLVVYNPCQSSPSLAILVPLWFIIISLVCLYLI